MRPPIDLAAQERAVRSVELESVRHLVEPGMRILEVGGGSGHQAAVLASWGAWVASVDVGGRARGATFHPVLLYDGVHLPFPDGTFDLIWSSNTLEHVVDLDALLGELRRVVVPGGGQVHAVPSASWRAWSMAAEPLGAPARLIARRRGRVVPLPHESSYDDPGAEAGPRPARFAGRVRALLWPGPHGEHPSALHELVAFRTGAWIRRLAPLEAEVVDVVPGGAFTTGRWTLPGLAMPARRRLARWLGSASTVLVLRDRRRPDPAASGPPASGQVSPSSPRSQSASSRRPASGST